MNDGLAYHIAAFGGETKLLMELKAALEQPDRSPPFVVSVQELPQEPGQHGCDLMVVDLDGQVSRALEFLTTCRRRYPHLPALALVGYRDTSAAVAAMKAGATDCVERSMRMSELSGAVAATLDQAQFPEALTRVSLTKAELTVFHLILTGMTSQKIADQLHRSKRTIDVHRHNVMRKLGAVGPVDLIRHAISMGLIRD